MRRTSFLVFTAFWICVLAVPPSTLFTGPLTLVHPNDLNSNTTAESLILLHVQQPIDGAARTCSSLSEALAMVDDLSTSVRQHLAFLVFDGQLRPNESLWLNATHSLSPPEGRTCPVYSLAHDAVKEVPCGSLLKALCTQSAPPTSLVNREDVKPGAEIVVPAGLAQYIGYDYFPLMQEASAILTTSLRYRDARSFRFLGVPYAQPPTGQLRFSPTHPAIPRGIIYATRFGNVCLQNGEDDFAPKGEAQSEDCLFLNVFTPSLPVIPSLAKLKAVGFWIHGGSLLVGSGSMAIYDGGNFASRGDVVIVTCVANMG